MADDHKSVDLFGIAPAAEATKIATEGAIAGASAFLGRICLPAAEEFGLLLRDRVSGWRSRNAVNILRKTEALNAKRENEHDLHAHPRLAMLAVEEGSWADTDAVHDMWAGLLSSSCNNQGGAEDNLIFMNILRQLTPLQASIITYSVENCEKFVAGEHFTYAEPRVMSLDALKAAFSCDDIHTLDYQMDYLREVGLFDVPGGFTGDSSDATLSPNALAISFYVRCQGFVGAPRDYFSDLPNRPPEYSTETKPPF